jgi:plastocyanin
MRSKMALIPVALPLLLTTAFTANADDLSAAICAEAEERYVEMFGHPFSQETGVSVVTMYKYKFCPGELTVPVGTTVRWVNVDKRTSHSVLLKEAGTGESDRLFPEESFEFTFLSAGQQDYVCGPHRDTQKMIGMITVVD